MQLYVWKGFCPDYTSGLAVAVAHDETEARALITKYQGCEVYEWGDLTIYPLDTPRAFAVPGGG